MALIGKTDPPSAGRSARMGRGNVCRVGGLLGSSEGQTNDAPGTSTDVFWRKAKIFQRVRATRAQETVDKWKFRSDTPATSYRVEPVACCQTPRCHRPRKPGSTASGGARPASRTCCSSCLADAVAMLDAIKERQGLRNRSQAFLQLIEEKGAAAQQMT